jgi:rfaE bifunctional protein nucleotidyltransferase chain/domain
LGQLISQHDLILQRQKWKGNGQCVVFVSGSFDLLHPGHIRLLEQARSHGDVLVVGVRNDASIRAENSSDEANGSSGSQPWRPVTPGAERAEILAALAAVDYVVELDESFPNALVTRLSPEIVVLGAWSTSTAPDAPEQRAAFAAGARVVTIPFEPGYSTAALLERITQSTA